MFSVRTLCGLELAAVVLLLSATSGCTSVNLIDWKRFRVPKASAKNPVVRIVGIWEAAEGQGLDGKPTRGFAGQILFFTHGKASPVRVDGDVTIDLYDEPADSADSSDPIHRFDFVGDAWTIHLTDSVLGPSYNVFIPYTRKHSWRANCSLRVQLKSNFGTTAYSEMVQVTLPGPMPKESQYAARERRLLPVGSRQEAADIKTGAALQRRTIMPATYESDAATEGLQPTVARAIHSGRVAATNNASQSQDEIFRRNLQHLETMLNELKQQQQQGSPTSEPAASDRPAGRRFQLEPAGKTLDNSSTGAT